MTRFTRRQSRYPRRRAAFAQGFGIGCGIYVCYLLAFLAACAVMFILAKTGACS